MWLAVDDFVHGFKRHDDSVLGGLSGLEISEAYPAPFREPLVFPAGDMANALWVFSRAHDVALSGGVGLGDVFHGKYCITLCASVAATGDRSAFVF